MEKLTKEQFFAHLDNLTMLEIADFLCGLRLFARQLRDVRGAGLAGALHFAQ